MKESEKNCSVEKKDCGCTAASPVKISLQEHWEKSYHKNSDNKLGWYQEYAQQSLDLIEKTGIGSHEKIIDIGSGASVFIDNLIAKGFENIIATDISQTALGITKKRLDNEALSKVQFVVDDLCLPTLLKEIKEVAVWHDRAVFHFLTDQADRQTYFELLDNAVTSGKFVILASFNLEGAERCSGLPVERYDEHKLAAFLGDNYQLITAFNFDYTMPSGANRPYIYSLFQKK